MQTDFSEEPNESVDDWMREIGVLRPDDSVDLDQLRKEMHDFRHMIREVPKVYSHITGGLLSKPNYFAHAVIEVFDEQREKEIADALGDALEDWKKELCR